MFKPFLYFAGFCVLLSMTIYQNPTTAKVLFCEICNCSISYKGRGRVPKTCSSKCKNRFDHLNKGSKLKQEIICSHCNNKFLTAFEHQRFCSANCRTESSKVNNDYKSKIYIYSCCDCSTNFTRKNHLSGVAVAKGIRCNSCSKELQRIRYRKKSLKRQSALSNPRISIDLIAKRDNFVCHLCNEIVDMEIPRGDRLGATLDHIQPLSKGGLDTMENVALAHWICNVRKGNKYDA